MKLKNWIKMSAIAAVIASPLVVAKDAPLFKKKVDAVEYRQHTFQVIRHNFGQMRAMIGGKRAFDQQEFQQRADNLAALAKMPWEAFLQGTDMKSISEKNSALPAIWSKKGEFDEIARLFEKNTAALAVAAKTGNKGKIKKALGQVGKNGCKGCHDNFKD